MSEGGRIVMVCAVAESDFRLIVIGGFGDATIGGSWNSTSYKSLSEIGEYVDNRGFKKYISSMGIEVKGMEEM